MSCSVLASALDGSSHNIYVYGGYDGQDSEQSPFNDLYILSLPSFTWKRAYVGNVDQGRSGHQCIRVFPDQMFVIGGQYKDPTHCIPVIQTFNLNTLEFQNQYNPDTWTEYQVPGVVTDEIGGK
jgi:hypothetical protein